MDRPQAHEYQADAAFFVDDRCVATCRNELVRFLRHFCSDLDLVEDLAHEALLRALSGRGCPADQSSAMRWLKRTAYHLWVDQYRSPRRREEPLEDPGDYPSQDGQVSSVKEREVRVGSAHVTWSSLELELDAALVAIPMDYRRLIQARYERGLSVFELARRHGTSAGSIRMRLFRGRRCLYRSLADRFRRRPSSGFMES